MYLPPYVQTALNILKEHGAQGYAVGGCVRDALLGLTPHDYDLAVNAPPAVTEACFTGYKVIETGLKHGTVTVVLEGHNLEITSFRTEGAYTDGRRPDSVYFTSDPAEDLSRRDFTVNAMAYAPETGLIDLFGGREDLKNKVLRCVGVPEQRFNEDALRILRALRFAAALGFAIEEATAAAVHACAGNLRHVSAERIFAELKGLMKGVYAAPVLREYRDVIDVCVPALAALPAEDYASAAETAGALRDETLSFAALLLPLGAETAEDVCRALKTDNKYRANVKFCIENLHTAFPTPGFARRFLGAWDRDKCMQLLRFRAAYGEETAILEAACGEKDPPPGTLAQLRIGGRELAALGITGHAIGETLNALLAMAAEGEIANDPAALLEAAKRMVGS